MILTAAIRTWLQLSASPIESWLANRNANFLIGFSAASVSAELQQTLMMEQVV